MLNMKAGEIEQFEVYVMPRMEGNLGTLDEWKKNKQLEDVHPRSMARQLIDGLKQLSDANVSHNDLKPGNVLFEAIDIYDSPRIDVNDLINPDLEHDIDLKIDQYRVIDQLVMKLIINFIQY